MGSSLVPQRDADGWQDAVTSTTHALAALCGAPVGAFQPLLDRVIAVGPTPDGSLGMEWVAPTGAQRFGLTVFEHGGRDDHLGVARRLCVAHFDGEAVDAWDRLMSELQVTRVGCHVGLAWDATHGFRLKLFAAGARDMAAVARAFGTPYEKHLIGVGCDFWCGGRYRERSYFQARSVDVLRGLAPAWDAGFAPSIVVAARQHVILTRTHETDALGPKATWSLIFPPEATLGSVEAPFQGLVHAELPRLSVGAAPFVLRPSALQIDRYRDGREEHELLITLAPG
ncbi:MAG: hypothetical protein R3B40_15155 [Polyangiales bacterium]|nr:hypothetical protein [Sandaracinaceae bacterium]